MSRLPLAAFAALVVAVGTLPAADPPKEPTRDVKSVDEWVKQLSSEDAATRRKAEDAIRALAGNSDAVAEALLDAAIDPRNRPAMDALIALGPRAVPAVTAALAAPSERRKPGEYFAILGRLGEDARTAAPVLLRLLKDPDPGVRGGAAGALGRIGAHSAAPALKELLADPDVRRAAADSLITLGADPAVVLPALLEMLRGKTEDDADPTILLLSRLGPDAAPAVPAIVARLPKVPQSRAGWVIATLTQIGPGAKEAIPALKELATDAKGVVRSDGREARRQIAVALWRIGRDPDAAKLLREDLGEPKRGPGQRWGVSDAELLWRIDPGPETVKALEAQLKSDKPEAMTAAAGVLGNKSKEAVPLLAKIAAHEQPYYRALAVTALVRLGPQAKEAIEALRGAAKDDVPEIAFWATVAVCRLDPKAETVAAVAGYLADRDAQLRWDAANVLGYLGAAAKPAVGRLTAALDDPEEGVRLAAAAALWRIESRPEALQAAAKLLRSTDPRIREQAATEIGGTFGADAKAAVPELVKRLFDPFSAVRSAAAEAIGRVGANPADAAPALLAVLDSDEPGFVHSAACEALGLIKPADKDAAAAALRKKLDHPDPLTRAHAALALYLVAGDTAGEKGAERGLGYRTYQVRITAAEALWRMKKDERAVPLLVRALEESNLDGTAGDNERYMAVRALGRIGPAAKPAVPELKKLLTHHDPALAATAAEALKAIEK